MNDTSLLSTVQELDCRVNDGIEVRLLWESDTGRVFVSVHDSRLDEFFEFDVDPAEALDAFRHPYAYANRNQGTHALAA
jgi:hypothetical protein